MFWIIFPLNEHAIITKKQASAFILYFQRSYFYDKMEATLKLFYTVNFVDQVVARSQRYFSIEAIHFTP